MCLVSDSSSNMQFTFFTLTTFIFLFFVFWKTINFAESLEMTLVAGGRGVCSLRHYDTLLVQKSIHDSPLIDI